jgi:hypothetical protein
MITMVMDVELLELFASDSALASVYFGLFSVVFDFKEIHS